MSDPAIERADTGTVAHLPAGEIYRRAYKAQQLAQIAAECATPGARVRDLARAERLLGEIGALVGGVCGDV